MSTIAPTLVAVWRIAFLTLSAPVIGAVLMLAIGRVTGARWHAIAPLCAPAFWLMPGAAGLAVCAALVPAPPHLHLWLSWWAVLLRALVVTGALSLTAARLRQGTGPTFAAITLAVYAMLVTPLAFDWMLGQVPGHAVSAVGMMHATQSIGSATAAALILRLGSPAFRRDMARLMVAAALGLAYLAFMDFLIVWYGNLPAHVDFYLARTAGEMAPFAWGALVLGLAAPILLLWLSGEDRGQRPAAACVLAGMLLFNAWWVAGGIAAILGAIALAGLLLALVWRLAPGEAHHG